MRNLGRNLSILFILVMPSLVLAAPAQQAPTIWDLGQREAGKLYPADEVAVTNRSCPTPQSFAITVEAPSWIKLSGPSEVLDVPPGGTKTTSVVVDLTAASPGLYVGRVRVRCTSCRPPLCVADTADIQVMVIVMPKESMPTHPTAVKTAVPAHRPANRTSQTASKTVPRSTARTQALSSCSWQSRTGWITRGRFRTELILDMNGSRLTVSSRSQGRFLFFWFNRSAAARYYGAFSGPRSPTQYILPNPFTDGGAFFTSATPTSRLHFVDSSPCYVIDHVKYVMEVLSPYGPPIEVVEAKIAW